MEKAVPDSHELHPQSAALQQSPCGGGCKSLENAHTASPDIRQLVSDHHAAVYRYAFRLTGSASDAEDVAQQVFLLAHQRIGQLREPERAGAWLLTIVRNVFLKERSRPASSVEPLLAEPIAPSVEDFPDWVDPEQLQQCLDRLPSDARAVLVMYFFEDCSYKEIATTLGVPIGTVMSRLARAKTRLREELTTWGRGAAQLSAHAD